MAFAIVHTSTFARETADTTAHDVDLTGILAGDRAVLFAVIDNDTVTVTISGMPAGWTQIKRAENLVLGGYTIEVWEKVNCTGSELSFQYTSSSAQKSMNRVFLIDGSHSTEAMAVTAGVHWSGVNADPGPLTAPWGAEDNLWVVFYGAEALRMDTHAYPVDYTSNPYTFTIGEVNDLTDVNYGVATRNNAVVTENPGVFTCGGGDRWSAFTFVIRPSEIVFPRVRRTNQITNNADTASHLVDLSGVASGDRALAFIAVDADGFTVTMSGFPAGWAQLRRDEYIAFGGVTIEIWEKKLCDGTETSFNVTLSTAQKGRIRVFLIEDHDGDTATSASLASGASTTTPNPPSLTAPWGTNTNLWIVFYAAAAPRMAASAYPTSYLDNQFTNADTANDNTHVAMALATRELFAATQDPSTFTAGFTDVSITVTLVVPSGSTLLSGAGANVSDGRGTLTMVGVQGLSGAGANASDGRGVLGGGTAAVPSGLSAVGLAYGHAWPAVHIVGFSTGTGFFFPHGIEVLPTTLIGSGANVSDGVGTLSYVGVSLRGGGGNVSSGFGRMGGTVVPPVVVTTVDILTSLALQLKYGLELLDQNDVFLADISDDLLTGTVSRNMNATIHGTARLRLSRTINWHNQRLRPYLVATEQINGGSVRFDLGIYLPETPSARTGQTPVTYEVEAYDKLVILDHPHGTAFTALAGTRVVATVESILSGLGLPHALGQASAATVPTTRSWPLDEANTTLRICNDLLGSISYRALYIDRTGYFRSEPYQSPTERAPVWHYDASSPTTTLAEEITEEIDLFSIPNRWIFVRDDPAQGAPIEGNGIYTVLNQIDGPTSIQARGRVITKVQRLEVADHASLVAAGNQIVQLDRQPLAHLAFAAVPNPLHWHADSVTVTSATLGLTNVIFGEQSWSLPLDGSDMAHRVRRSVQI